MPRYYWKRYYNILILLTHPHRGKKTQIRSILSQLFLRDSNEIKRRANEVSCSLDFSPEKTDLGNLASVSSKVSNSESKLKVQYELKYLSLNTREVKNYF